MLQVGLKDRTPGDKQAAASSRAPPPAMCMRHVQNTSGAKMPALRESTAPLFVQHHHCYVAVYTARRRGTVATTFVIY